MLINNLYNSTHSYSLGLSKLVISNKLNFSAGPGALPDKVLTEASQSIIALENSGISVLGMSHRSEWFREVVDETKRNIRKLLSIPEDYHVLFLQGGSSLQFSMIPMNFLRNSDQTAEFIVSGYWSAKAPTEATFEGSSKVVWTGKSEGFRKLPSASELELSSKAAYLHYVSNETVEGLEFPYIPEKDNVPIICDMASDILSKPIPVDKFSLIYAHAQKNLGPAGVTLVIIKNDLLRRSISEHLPTYFRYETHIKNDSIYNTPPVFAIYTTLLVTRWLLDDVGGLDNMASYNTEKADLIYQALDDATDFYIPHAEKLCRSKMNVSFFLKTKELEKIFLNLAEQEGFYGLGGHRSLGGLRASLYNAVTKESCKELALFLNDFAKKFG